MYRLVSRHPSGDKFMFWQDNKLIARPYSASNFGGLGYPATFTSQEEATMALWLHHYGFSEAEVKRQLDAGALSCYQPEPC